MCLFIIIFKDVKDLSTKLSALLMVLEQLPTPAHGMYYI